MKNRVYVRLVALASALSWLMILVLLTGSAAAQSQNVQPGYLAPAAPAPQQGGSGQTLDLPRVAPQSSSTAALELPRRQPQVNSSLEAPIQRQPQTSVGRISVTATDDTGRWVQDLRTQDLRVYEDGIERPVLGLQRDTDTPITIGIVVDTSGSMAWKLAAAKAALQHFVGTLNPRDQAFLVAFSSQSFLLQDFTDSPMSLDRAINMLHANGQTSLYDAVVLGLQKVETGRWPKKALLVMTDGMDNTSTHTLDDAIEAARRAGVLIYTVGLGTTGGMTTLPFPGGMMQFGAGRGFRPHQRGGGDEELVDAQTLKRLSDETGATTFIMNPRVTDMSALDAHFQAISAELREQYTVRYTSAGGMRPHQIRVEGRPGIEVRAPKWAGASASDYGS